MTYITAPDAAFDPTQQAVLSKDTLSIRGLDAAREERLTFASNELPEVSMLFFCLSRCMPERAIPIFKKSELIAIVLFVGK